LEYYLLIVAMTFRMLNTSDGFYAFDDPLEAALFSILIELMKELDEKNMDL
jgi:hypothetical protein